MSTANRILFNRCIEVILKSEGGYVNHPADPGGETKFGICKRYFPDEDIKNLTEKRARELYYYYYWLPMNLFGINNSQIVLQMFDFGVNTGIRRAIRAAQQILGVTVDGICGKITKKAINDYEGDFLSEYKQSRKEYYEGLAENKPKMEVFLKGWLSRVEHTKFNI